MLPMRAILYTLSHDSYSQTTTCKIKLEWKGKIPVYNLFLLSITGGRRLPLLLLLLLVIYALTVELFVFGFVASLCHSLLSGE